MLWFFAIVKTSNDWRYMEYVLTVQDYACICDSQRVYGHTCVVSIVLFRHIEKYQHGLFTFVFDFDSVQSVEKAAMNKLMVNRAASLGC